MSALKNYIVELAVLKIASKKITPYKSRSGEIAVLERAEAQVACIENGVLEIDPIEFFLFCHTSNHQSVAEIFFGEVRVEEDVNMMYSIAGGYHFFG